MAGPANWMIFLNNNRQAVFLVSLLLVLMGSAFAPEEHRSTALLILLLQNMLVGRFLVRKRARWVRTLYGVLIGLTVLRLGSSLFTELRSIQRVGELVFILFYLIHAVFHFGELLRYRRFTKDSVFAVFSGFILLCLAFGFVLMFMDNVSPGSISGIGWGAPTSEYIYFSFITMLTIGYGDMTPQTQVAKEIVTLGALVGHFYTVFVTAIVIGKMLMVRSTPTQED